jgi:hypothetical protein
MNDMIFGAYIIPTGAFPNTSSTTEIDAVPFVCQRVSQVAEKASNAFGATTIIRRSVEDSLSFSTSNYATGQSKPYWTTQVEGSDARDLAKAMRIRITGVLGAWKPGQTIVCYTERSEATMDLPFDRSTHDCMFATKSIRFEIIDNRTQTILYSWE